MELLLSCFCAIIQQNWTGKLMNPIDIDLEEHGNDQPPPSSVGGGQESMHPRRQDGQTEQFQVARRKGRLTTKV